MIYFGECVEENTYFKTVKFTLLLKSNDLHIIQLDYNLREIISEFCRQEIKL